VAFEEQTLNFEEDYANMKKDLERFPCAQCPRYIDGDVDMVQSNAIMRYIGRKYGLYGSTLKQKAAVDMVIDTVEAIKLKYLNLIYVDRVSDEGKDSCWKSHLDPSTVSERNSGAHMAYIRGLMKKYGSGGFVAGGSFTIADVLVFDIFEAFERVYGEKLRLTYPELRAHYEKIAGWPRIEEYLATGHNLPQNANGLG